MPKQIPVDDALTFEEPRDQAAIEAGPHIAYKRILFVNVVFVGTSEEWVLIDAGLRGSARFIIKAAERRFGSYAKPRAILLTHAHFDHVGALEELCKSWNVPVYAHPREFPFLTGQAAYPPPEPALADGLMSALSRFFPANPIDISERLKPFPEDGPLPNAPEWRAIATPGHTPGHVSFWSQRDKTLISGDAVITTAQETAYGALTQAVELHGPPRYFTSDWSEAEQSVRALAELEPRCIVPGHGRALWGRSVKEGLHTLAREFMNVSVPEDKRSLLAEAAAAESPSQEAGTGRIGDLKRGELPLIDENISTEPSSRPLRGNKS